MTPADAREPFVRYEQDGRIVTLTLNRPEARNAIATHEDCEELAGAFERANDDPDQIDVPVRSRLAFANHSLPSAAAIQEKLHKRVVMHRVGYLVGRLRLGRRHARL